MQIAQIPNRHEPDFPGELNYSYVFDLLEQLGYDGYIGLEYNPAGRFLLVNKCERADVSHL